MVQTQSAPCQSVISPRVKNCFFAFLSLGIKTPSRSLHAGGYQVCGRKLFLGVDSSKLAHDRGTELNADPVFLVSLSCLCRRGGK